MHTFTWGSCAGTSVPPDGEYILSVNADGTLTGTQSPSLPLIAQPNEDAFYFAFAMPKNIKINGEASYEGDTVQEFGSGDVGLVGATDSNHTYSKSIAGRLAS